MLSDPTPNRFPNFENLDLGQVGPIIVDGPNYCGPVPGTALHRTEAYIRDERGTVGIYAQFRTANGDFVTETWAPRFVALPKF